MNFSHISVPMPHEHLGSITGPPVHGILPSPQGRRVRASGQPRPAARHTSVPPSAEITAASATPDRDHSSSDGSQRAEASAAAPRGPPLLPPPHMAVMGAPTSVRKLQRGGAGDEEASPFRGGHYQSATQPSPDRLRRLGSQAKESSAPMLLPVWKPGGLYRPLSSTGQLPAGYENRNTHLLPPMPSFPSRTDGDRVGPVWTLSQPQPFKSDTSQTPRIQFHSLHQEMRPYVTSNNFASSSNSLKFSDQRTDAHAASSSRSKPAESFSGADKQNYHGNHSHEQSPEGFNFDGFHVYHNFIADDPDLHQR